MMTVSSEISTALQATGNAGRVITMGFSNSHDPSYRKGVLTFDK